MVQCVCIAGELQSNLTTKPKMHVVQVIPQNEPQNRIHVACFPPLLLY